MSITTADKAAGADLPDGVHATCAVRWLARLAGWEGRGDAPRIIVLGIDDNLGFSEATAFVGTSDGRGYYRTTMSECTCPDFRFRKGPARQHCKHQLELVRALRIDARNRQRREERATQPDREDDIGGHGFNMPPEGWR